jgi:small subunit ribosomal protein S20
MAETEKKKVKVPTAKKRDIQNKKRNLRNKAFKSKVRTALNSLKDAITKKDDKIINEKLSLVYSLVDKGTKKGIYTKNQAARMKSKRTIAKK